MVATTIDPTCRGAMYDDSSCKLARTAEISGVTGTGKSGLIPCRGGGTSQRGERILPLEYASPVGRATLPVTLALTVIKVVKLEFQPYGASPVKGLAEGSGVDKASVIVLVKTFDVVEVNVKVLELDASGVAPLWRTELSGTGTTVMADVLITNEFVDGGVLPPSQVVVPLCSAKEYGP